jgi:hypothetical protein
MQTRIWLAGICAAAFAVAFAAPPSDAATQKRTAVTKKAAKRHGPVPVTMARPRTRIVVRARSFLDPGTEVLPGSQHEFTDYAYPPYHRPMDIIENRSGLHRSPLPGPFFPWNN